MEKQNYDIEDCKLGTSLVCSSRMFAVPLCRGFVNHQTNQLGRTSCGNSSAPWDSYTARLTHVLCGWAMWD